MCSPSWKRDPDLPSLPGRSGFIGRLCRGQQLQRPTGEGRDRSEIRLSLNPAPGWKQGVFHPADTTVGVEVGVLFESDDWKLVRILPNPGAVFTAERGDGMAPAAVARSRERVHGFGIDRDHLQVVGFLPGVPGGT